MPTPKHQAAMSGGPCRPAGAFVERVAVQLQPLALRLPASLALSSGYSVSVRCVSNTGNRAHH